jgi:ABC-type branched-subunit amino acid transport system substrate-binding protein
MYRRAVAAGAVMAAAGLVLAGCSSSGSSGTASTGTAGNASSGGSQVKIMDISVFQSAALSLPDTDYSVAAKFDAVNAAGGINGQKVEVLTCNDQNDPNVAANCARQAVADKVVAVVAPYEQYAPQILPVLQAAGIPYVGNTLASTVDGTNPDSFPRDGGVVVNFAGVGLALVNAGCKKIGMLVLGGVAVTQLAAQTVQKVAQAKNVGFAEASVGLTEASFSAPVSSLISQGADCIGMTLTPSEGPAAVQAIRQSGKNITIAATTAQFSTASLQAMGSEANGVLLAGNEYLPSSNVPGVTALKAAMAKYTPGQSLQDIFGVGGWAAATMLASEMQTIKGPITAASVLAAFDHASTVDSAGLYGPMNFAAPSPLPIYPRLRNNSFLTFKLENGVPQQIGTGFQQVTPSE